MTAGTPQISRVDPAVLPAPPSYDPIADLPRYAPVNQHSTLVYKKTELVSPFHVAKSRAWRPLLMTLNSTQLEFHALRSARLESCLDFFFKKIDILAEERCAQKQAGGDAPAAAAPGWHWDVGAADDEFDAWGGPSSSANANANASLGVKNLLKSTGHSLLPASKFNDDLVRSQSKTHFEIFIIIAGMFKISASETLALSKLLFGSVSSHHNAATVQPLMGALESSYTMQYCQAGKASDYGKKSFLLRLRIELDQSLVKFASLKKLVQWYYLLCHSAQLSLPIEQRFSERVKTIPGRHTRGALASRRMRDPDVFSVFRRRRSSDLSLDSHYNLRTTTSAAIGAEADEADEALVEDEYPFLDKSRFYPATLVESMDFYKSFKNYSFLNPDFKQFRRISTISSSSSAAHNYSPRSRLGSFASTEGSVSTEPSELSLQHDVSSSDTSLGDSASALSPDMSGSYQFINEVDLFDVIYSYKCIRSLKSSDKWNDSFVVLSSKGATNPPSEEGAKQKKSLFSKVRRPSAADTDTKVSPKSTDINNALQSLSKHGVQLFTSKYVTASAHATLSPVDVESLQEFQILQGLNAQFFKKVLLVADTSKKSLRLDHTLSDSYDRLIFVDSYSILKFLKSFKSNKLPVLNHTVDKDGNRVVNPSAAFCKKMMIIEEGLVAWL